MCLYCGNNFSTEMSSDVNSIQVGREFDNYEDFKTTCSNYQKEHFVQLCVRGSVTIINAMKKPPTKKKTAKIYNQRIRYVFLHYTCIHGGRKFISRSKGERRNHR